jgi:hypothetical protein
VAGLQAQIAEARRTRREVRARLNAKWDAESRWRVHWWDRLIVWGGGILGAYLLVWGDDTVDHVFGIVLVAMPALLALMTTAVWVYVLWSLLRERSRHQ